MKAAEPYIITIPTKGSPLEGYLGIGSKEDGLPFEIKRMFFTYNTPTEVSRGRHAHYETEMVLIAAQGAIEVTCINTKNEKLNFVLKNPKMGLFIPRLWWHEMHYSENAIQIVVCNTPYNENDYIRDFEKFKSLNY